MTVRHFLTLDDLTPDEFRALIARAIELGEMHRAGTVHQPLVGRVLAMIFEKSSTRTRLSFEAGMCQLGGDAIFLSPRDTQLGRGEPIEDTARVIGRMCDAVMLRTGPHGNVERFAEYAGVPVINALTDRCHPCQLLADMQTFFELHGDIAGRTAAWIGDGNNMCHSWINAARLLGFELRIACPGDFEPDNDILTRAGDAARLVDSPAEAADGADVLVTDVWASMGQESEQDHRSAAFRDFQVDGMLMARANEDAVFMHCLPAHRGEEVAAEVIDGPQSVVWREAENRLHAQKALLEMLLAR
ncbi:ornithine carbamoyltransferase [Halofilum ochraceum]|uniref:ornithine carbamoyltransferase n=1 Tax=Halofilum ochraceum TaxID=1611323 RepID=UPI00082AEF1F|nr:ornithine carbamoyltransferase [Halofilum ochraceum]